MLEDSRGLRGEDLSENDLDKARLGLGHAFSRHRMQLDPNRQEILVTSQQPTVLIGSQFKMFPTLGRLHECLVSRGQTDYEYHCLA